MIEDERKSGRVVDGSGLENRRTRKGIGGSNPSSSAIQSQDGASLAALLSHVRQILRQSSVPDRNSELRRIHNPQNPHPTTLFTLCLYRMNRSISDLGDRAVKPQRSSVMQCQVFRSLAAKADQKVELVALGGEQP